MNWYDQDLKATLATIDEGCHVKTSLRMHAIHVSSLCDHVIGTTMGRNNKHGVVTLQEEDQLVK